VQKGGGQFSASGAWGRRFAPKNMAGKKITDAKKIKIVENCMGIGRNVSKNALWGPWGVGERVKMKAGHCTT